MEQQHTTEPWISEGSFIGIPNGKGTFYMVPMSGINQDRREADARRIVACVNACAGISTELLEECKTLSYSAYNMIRDVEKQRDELLAALERAETAMEVCSDWITEIEMDDGWTTTADEKLKISAAIASAKGGAA